MSTATTISVSPTTSATPDYAVGDAVGGKQTLTSAAASSGGSIILVSLQVVDNANVSPVLDILFFDADPTAATITDNAAFVFSTDKAKLVGKVSIYTGDYSSANSTAVGSVKNIGIQMKASGSANLYVAMVAQATINLAATSDLRIDYNILQY